MIFNVESYVEEGSWVRVLFVLNPMYCFLSISRAMVMGFDLDPVLVLSAASWSVALIVIGFLWFRAGEERYARD